MAVLPTSNVPVYTWHGCYDDSWRDLIVPDAFAHPAKFAPGLVRRIYAEGLSRGWWRPGDLIGDPFGGIAGGGIMAGYAGLNWLGVELEPRFVDLGNRNLALQGPKWMALGDASRVRLVQGDSRRFADVVGQAAGVVTSPPYNPACKADGTTADRDPRAERMTGSFRTSEAYGSTPGQIGRLYEGDLNAVVTSPPYADSVDGSPDGIDWIKADPKWRTSDARSPGRGAVSDGYGVSPGQIGLLKGGNVDAVVTSPPYGDSDQNYAEGWKHIDPAKAVHNRHSRNREASYGKTEGQIANSGGETYWQAMHAVYAQCAIAIKPGGVMAVVLKDYVKNKQRVPLCDQTLSLLQHLGFAPLCRVHAMLVKEQRHAGLFHEHVEKKERKSFFRRLAEQKGSPRIDHEKSSSCGRRSFVPDPTPEPSLFDRPADPGPILPCDPSAPALAVPRLSRQCRDILERLRRGPGTNTELARIALKYTSRISDLRKHGYVVEVQSHDHSTGLVVYALVEGGAA